MTWLARALTVSIYGILAWPAGAKRARTTVAAACAGDSNDVFQPVPLEPYRMGPGHFGKSVRAVVPAVVREYPPDRDTLRIEEGQRPLS